MKIKVTIIFLAILLIGSLLIVTQKTANTYIPGVYTTSLVLNDSVVEIEVTVDEENINSIRLVNLDEAVTAEYPYI